MLTYLCIALSFLLLASTAALGVLFFKLKQVKKRKETYEVKELLQDLLSGDALIQVSRVAPADVFLRAPRGKE